MTATRSIIERRADVVKNFAAMATRVDAKKVGPAYAGPFFCARGDVYRLIHPKREGKKDCDPIYRVQWVNAMTELCPIYGHLPMASATILTHR